MPDLPHTAGSIAALSAYEGRQPTVEEAAEVQDQILGLFVSGAIDRRKMTEAISDLHADCFWLRTVNLDKTGRCTCKRCRRARWEGWR